MTWGHGLHWACADNFIKKKTLIYIALTVTNSIIYIINQKQGHLERKESEKDRGGRKTEKLLRIKQKKEIDNV